MKQVYLKQPYRNYGSNEIINVSDEVASDLIGQGVGRVCENRDFLVKPEFGESKAFDTHKLNKGRKIVRGK